MDERIHKYFYEELSESERLSFLCEVESDEVLKGQFVDYQNTHALLNIGKQLENRYMGKQKYDRFMLQKKKPHTDRRILRWVGYAAAVVVLVVSSNLITYTYTHNEPPAQIANMINTMITPAGQRACLVLQDGTEVWLNAKSKLVYPAQFTGEERKVTIEGEAFFDVAKDPSKPFIVSALGVEMKVLGTKFNVFCYPETGFVQTSLVEGAIKVFYAEKEEEGVILQSDQQVTVRDGQMMVEKIKYPEHFLWKEGVYCFEKEPLINILKKLELYYDIRIIVKDTSLFNEAYTGKFRQRDSLDDIFRVLQQIRSFKVEKDMKNNSITLSK